MAISTHYKHTVIDPMLYAAMAQNNRATIRVANAIGFASACINASQDVVLVAQMADIAGQLLRIHSEVDATHDILGTIAGA